MPVLVVAAYRTTEVDPSGAFTETLAALAHEGCRATVVLAPFREGETARLAASVAGGSVAEPVAAAIQRATEGNPFLIGEVVRNLQSQGHDLDNGDTAQGEWTVPDLVRQVTTARLARLQPGTSDLLRYGAVLGDGFTFELLRTMGEFAEPAALDALDEALAGGLLRSERDTYHFAHALIRRTVYDALSPARRQRLHLRAAETIESVYAGRLRSHRAALAGHYRLAGANADAPKVIDAELQAGEAAQAVLAFEDAMSHWETALTLLDELAAPSLERAKLLERIGELMVVATVDRARGLAYLERSLGLYEADGHDEAAARLHLRIARQIDSTPATRDVHRILEHCRAAERVFGRDDERVEVVHLYLAYSSAASFGVYTEELGRAARRALEIAERLGESALAARATSYRGSYHMNVGHVREGLALIERAWQIADQLDDPAVGFWCVVSYATRVGRMLADYHDTRQWHKRELAKTRLAQAPHLRAGILSGLSYGHYVLGEIDEARRLAAQAKTWGSPSLAHSAIWEGNWDQAVALGMDDWRKFSRSGETWNGYWASQGLALAHRLRGEYEQAETMLSHNITLGVDGPCVPIEMTARAAMSLLLAECGRAGEARHHLNRCQAILAEGEDWRGMAGRVLVAEAATTAAEGALDRSRSQFERAIMVFRRYGLLWDEADASVTWGCAALEAGELIEGHERLDTARALYTRIGAAEPWFARVERLRAARGCVSTASGDTTTLRSPSHPDGLTPREVEVLGLLAAGLSNREIAETLVVSVRTVGRHVDNIYGKIGVHERAKARQYARDKGLVARSEPAG
jgi:DNA-binding CsgD family transcriptional regulator